MACDCKISVSYTSGAYSAPQFVINPQEGLIDGKSYYTWYDETLDVNFQLNWSSANNRWEVFNLLVVDTIVVMLPEDTDCPANAIENLWQVISIELDTFCTYIDCSVNNIIDVPVINIPEDCNEYYPCRNQNLLKKSRKDLSLSVPSMKNLELFGVSGCEQTWENIFMRYLIIDALNCLPYGVYSEDTENCLISKLKENCNC